VSLPEKIAIYLLVDPATTVVLYASHDAKLSVLAKEAYRESGREVDVLKIVSSRRPKATGETEHRCFACLTPHTISVEACAEWPSRMFDSICEIAMKRADRAARELDWRSL
jgi:hypothetical protein